MDLDARNSASVLTEMSLEDLWQLVPISLVDPRSEWKCRYEEMRVFLEDALKDTAGLRINHIGSTAIGSIKSKDIVDILIEVDPGEPLSAVAEHLEELGFIRMSESPMRISMNLGYTPEGFAKKVFHVHLRYRGDNDELYFRDYLSEHPDVAREYEALKLLLCAKYENNRDAYTSGKEAFVRKWSLAARSEFGVSSGL